MGNYIASHPRFERLKEEQPSGSLSFEPLPAMKEKDSMHFIRTQEVASAQLKSHAPAVMSRRSKTFCLTLTILLASLLVLCCMTSAAIGSAATAIFMMNNFVSREELHQLANQSHTHCADKFDTLEGWYNDSLKLVYNEISSLQRQLDEVHTLQADIERQIKDIKTNMAKQIHIFQEQIGNLSAEDDMMNSEISNAQRNVSQLWGHVNQLQDHASNFSVAHEALANKTNTVHTELSSLASSMQNGLANVSERQSELSTQILSLEHNVSQLADQVGVLQGSVQQATKQLSTVQSDTSLSDRLGQLESRVNGLNTEMHRPVNLYKHCQEDNRSCSIDPSRSRDYWRDCATVYLPLHKEV